MKRDARQNRRACTLPMTDGAQKGGNRITEEPSASGAVEKGPLKFWGSAFARDTGLRQRGRVRKKYPGLSQFPGTAALLTCWGQPLAEPKRNPESMRSGKKQSDFRSFEGRANRE